MPDLCDSIVQHSQPGGHMPAAHLQFVASLYTADGRVVHRHFLVAVHDSTFPTSRGALAQYEGYARQQSQHGRRLSNCSQIGGV